MTRGMLLTVIATCAAVGLLAMSQFKGGNVITKISDDFGVAPQLMPSDLQSVADQGYRSIIVNRPDGEGMGQPSYADMEAAAAALGLKTIYVPVSPSGVTPVDAARFRDAYQTLPKPVLAYCRSGARSTTVWQMAQSR